MPRVPIKPTWESDCGTVKLWLGDCIDVMNSWPNKEVDAIVTDPPYGVGVDYNSFDDTESEVGKLAERVLHQFKRVTHRIALTPGNNRQHLWGIPSWTMAWIEPAGNGRSSWGFQCWHPIMVWGKCPYLRNGLGARRDIFDDNRGHVIDVEHPCPKPFKFTLWLVKRMSALRTDIIADPFMGSGTTGVAALRLNRKFYGIEIDPKYFKIAKQRIQREIKCKEQFVTKRVELGTKATERNL